MPRRPKYTLAEKQRLRSQHTCVLKMDSRTCIGCNTGVPYPALSVEEILQSMSPVKRYVRKR